MKDVPGENVGTVVRFLKGAFMLIQNCVTLLTDTIGLMNDTMCSADCNEFKVFMQSVYFNHKRRSQPIAPVKYLELAEHKYRTMYQQGKWTASKSDALSGFYIGSGGGAGRTNAARGGGRTGTYGGRGGGRGGDVSNGGNRWGKLTCHNCGKQGHITQNCFLPGGGAETQGSGGGAEDDGYFPGVDERALRRPPRGREPCIRTLPDGTPVKWYSLCGSWGSHFRARHTAADNVPIVEATDNVPAEGNVAEAGVQSGHGVDTAVGTLAGSPAAPEENIAISDQGGAMARLRQAGLI